MPAVRMRQMWMAGQVEHAQPSVAETVVPTGELRKYFKQKRTDYSHAAWKENYEQGDIDATWSLSWRLVRYDSRPRSADQIRNDYNLYFENGCSGRQADPPEAWKS